MYRDECWDGIHDLDIAKQRTPDGKYYCDLCLPEYRKFYSSKEELWVKHSFEPLLEWANKTFVFSNHLCLFESEGGGITQARIVDISELDGMSDKASFVESVPVIRR